MQISSLARNEAQITHKITSECFSERLTTRESVYISIKEDLRLV